MNVEQIYNLTNTVTQEVLGRENVVNEDLSNVVDVGTEIFNANAVDNYVRSLVNHIGKMVFVNRPYTGSAPSVLMDGWEYGSVLEKVTAEIPEATENESWMLEDGASYDTNIFYQPRVSTKFFNKRTTFEVPHSVTEKQVRESFSNAQQLNGFNSMLFDVVDKSMTIKTDGLIMRTVNNMIAETMYSDFPTANYGSASTNRCVNILKLYNDSFNTSLTASECFYDPAFIRFATFTMGVRIKRIHKISSLFNIGNKDRFTSPDRLHIIMLSDFKVAADVFLQSSVFHDEYTKLAESEVVPYWQGSGTSFSFNDITNINIKTSSGHNVNVSGIIGVMFDRDALGVTNIDKRVTTNYNPKAEFFNYWHKFDAGYFNDFNENCVVFYVA